MKKRKRSSSSVLVPAFVAAMLSGTLAVTALTNAASNGATFTDEEMQKYRQIMEQYFHSQPSLILEMIRPGTSVSPTGSSTYPAWMNPANHGEFTSSAFSRLPESMPAAPYVMPAFTYPSSFSNYPASMPTMNDYSSAFSVSFSSYSIPFVSSAYMSSYSSYSMPYASSAYSSSLSSYSMPFVSSAYSSLLSSYSMPASVNGASMHSAPSSDPYGPVSERVTTIPFTELLSYSPAQLDRLDMRLHTQIARLDDMIASAREKLVHETDPLSQDYLSDRLFRLLSDRDILVDQISDIAEALPAISGSGTN